MTQLKNYHKIIIVSVMSIGLYFVFKKTLKPMTIKTRFKENIRLLSKYFSPAIIMNMERIYRIETNHFKSRQFIFTNSPGMEKHAEKYPYGWNTLHKIIWSAKPLLRPIGSLNFVESGTGITKPFLKFPTLYAAMFTVCAFLEYYGNNPGRWYSTNIDSQQGYNESLRNFIPIWSNEILT